MWHALTVTLAHALTHCLHAQAVSGQAAATWAAPCFAKSSASVSVATVDGVLTATIEFDVSDPSSGLCSDALLIGTRQKMLLKASCGALLLSLCHAERLLTGCARACRS